MLLQTLRHPVERFLRVNHPLGQMDHSAVAIRVLSDPDDAGRVDVVLRSVEVGYRDESHLSLCAEGALAREKGKNAPPRVQEAARPEFTACRRDWPWCLLTTPRRRCLHADAQAKKKGPPSDRAALRLCGCPRVMLSLASRSEADRRSHVRSRLPERCPWHPRLALRVRGPSPVWLSP